MAKYVEKYPVTVLKTGWLCPQGHVHRTEHAAENCKPTQLQTEKPTPVGPYRCGFAMATRENGWTYRQIGNHFGISPSMARTYAKSGERMKRNREKRPDLYTEDLTGYRRGIEDGERTTKPA